MKKRAILIKYKNIQINKAENIVICEKNVYNYESD